MKSKMFYEEVLVRDKGSKRIRSEKRAYIPTYSNLSADLLREFLETGECKTCHETPHYLYRETAEYWMNFGPGCHIPKEHSDNLLKWQEFLIEKGKLKKS